MDDAEKKRVQEPEAVNTPRETLEHNTMNHGGVVDFRGVAIMAAALCLFLASCAGPSVRILPRGPRGACIAVFEPRNATGKPQRDNRYTVDANPISSGPKPGVRGSALLRALFEEGLRNRGFKVAAADAVDRVVGERGADQSFLDVLRRLRKEHGAGLALLSVVYAWEERLSDIEPVQFVLDADVIVVATDTGEELGSLRGFHWTYAADQDQLLDNHLETYSPGAGTWYVRRFIRDALSLLMGDDGK